MRRCRRSPALIADAFWLIWVRGQAPQRSGLKGTLLAPNRACIILDLSFDWRTTQMFLLTARSVSMETHYLEEQDQDSIWHHIPADKKRPYQIAEIRHCSPDITLGWLAVSTLQRVSQKWAPVLGIKTRENNVIKHGSEFD